MKPIPESIAGLSAIIASANLSSKVSISLSKLSFPTFKTLPRGLSLEDGCATITDFTAYLIAEGLKYIGQKNSITFLLCGGGRKNSNLINCIKNYISNENNITLKFIDNYNLNGDYIESQAFGYLSIRSFLKLPISYPKTTGCELPTVGGKLIKNF